MYEGKLVFSQLMDHAPQHLFRKCVREHGGNRYVKSFPCWSQFLCMAFAQLSCRTSLRDIEVSLRAHGRKLHHMGIRGGVSRNTLANANRRRDWRSLSLQVMNQAGVVTEKVWFNFEPNRVHWASLAGRDFTHRQTVKRKVAGWGRRYAAMPPGERLAVLSAIMIGSDNPPK